MLATYGHTLSDAGLSDTGGRWGTPGGGPEAPQTGDHGLLGNNVSSLTSGLATEDESPGDQNIIMTVYLSLCHAAWCLPGQHGVVKQCRERPRQDIILLRTEKYDIFTGKNVKIYMLF